MKSGDRIAAADGKKIANFDDLTEFLLTKKPNDVVKITVVRAQRRRARKTRRKRLPSN